MATIKEIALGVTAVLQHSNKPEPLPIDFWGDSAKEGAEFVRVVLAECHDAGISLKLVRVPVEVWAELSSFSQGSLRPPGVELESAFDLKSRIELWRNPRP